MHHYITHLLTDLEHAASQAVPELDFGETYEEFEAIMLQIEEGRLVPSKQLLNVSFEELPPADRLSSEQAHWYFKSVASKRNNGSNTRR